MNDLSKIVSNMESLGQSVEIQQFCGITWTDPENPEVSFTDGNPAVGELTGEFEDDIVVHIPVCESCLELVSQGVNRNISLKE